MSDAEDERMAGIAVHALLEGLGRTGHLRGVLDEMPEADRNAALEVHAQVDEGVRRRNPGRRT